MRSSPPACGGPHDPLTGAAHSHPPTHRLHVNVNTSHTPIRDTLLPYGRQSIDDDDIEAVVAALGVGPCQ